MAFNLEESAIEAYKKNRVTGPRRQGGGMIVDSETNDENQD